jgi:DNA-binding XRE family transcriptional regulator
MATAANVLPIFGPPVQKSYRAAVAHCIRQVKLRHGLNNVSLAEALGCSNQTIANAENEESDLSGVTLMRMAWTYGEEAIAAVRQLYLCNVEEPLTLGDHLEAIERHTRAVRKELDLK